MLTFESFRGINNVDPRHRARDTDLVQATNVDIGLTGELSRRGGFSLEDADCHKNVHQGKGFMLATNGADLRAVTESSSTVIHPALGSSRVWYCNLPDGRTTFSNGLIHGITNGAAGMEWSIPFPASLGHADALPGALFPGSYRYHLTYVRLADLAEGPALSSEPITIDQGGLLLEALPVRAGYAINVYLSGKDGEGAYLAGVTTGAEFTFAGQNSTLITPCRTLGMRPMPVGTVTAFWRGRLIVAVGNAIWASEPWAPHLTKWRGFIQFPGDVTMVQAVESGLWIGTTEDLVYLGGDNFEGMRYSSTGVGPVVLGSGVTVPGDKIGLGEGRGAPGDAFICIAGGLLVAGFSNGQATRLTADRYKTDVTEVAATFRMLRDIPQYIAIPQ